MKFNLYLTNNDTINDFIRYKLDKVNNTPSAKIYIHNYNKIYEKYIFELYEKANADIIICDNKNDVLQSKKLIKLAINSKNSIE